MTRRCNFRCGYCYFPPDNSPIKDVLPAQRIVDFLNSTGREWAIGLTGGEPMLYPDFAGLCRSLTQNHRLQADTNLSLSKIVRQFAESVDPAKVDDVYAALHIEERERRGGVAEFIDNVLLLKERGFPVTVNYVIHPSLVGRFKKDVEYFGARGIKLLPRPFKGVFQRRHYPAGYNAEAKALFAQKISSGKKMVFNFKDVPCEAGSRLIRLEPDGSVLRCSGDRTVLGHILTEVRLYDGPEPCRVNRCPCFGPDYVILTVAQEHFLQGLSNLVRGNRREAYQAFERTLEADPGASNAFNNLGLLYWQDGEADRALACLREAVLRHPENKVYLLNQAALLAALFRTQEAFEACASYLGRRHDKAVAEFRERLQRGETIAPALRLCLDVLPGNNVSEVFMVD